MSDSGFLINTHDALYARRLIQRVRKYLAAPQDVFVECILGKFRVHYVCFVGDSIQINTVEGQQLYMDSDEWAKVFRDSKGNTITASRLTGGPLEEGSPFTQAEGHLAPRGMLNEIEAVIDPLAIGQLVSQACRSFELLDKLHNGSVAPAALSARGY